MSTINLGGLKKTAPKAKQEKPVLPDPDGSLAIVVSHGITSKQSLEAHELAVKQANDTLSRAVLDHAFVAFQGRSAGIEDSFQVRTVGGKAMVSLKNAYKVPEDLAPVREILGEELFSKVMRNTFTISIDSDAIPDFVLQSFIDELTKLARSVDAMLGTPEGTDGPVFNAITVKERVSVVKSFHEERHALLTPDQNRQLQAVLPCQVSVRYDY